MTTRPFAPLTAESPIIGRVCPLCERALAVGDVPCLLVGEPADDDNRRKRDAGRAHTAEGTPAHWSCAGPLKPKLSTEEHIAGAIHAMVEEATDVLEGRGVPGIRFIVLALYDDDDGVQRTAYGANVSRESGVAALTEFLGKLREVTK